jgi:hypothetical protein
MALAWLFHFLFLKEALENLKGFGPFAMAADSDADDVPSNYEIHAITSPGNFQSG